jgi:hypothetical protein
MVISCKNYLTNNGSEDLRKLAADLVIERLDVVWRLYKYYKDQYNVMKDKTHKNEENYINLSEVYIFGKFEAISKRMHKVGTFLCEI